MVSEQEVEELRTTVKLLKEKNSLLQQQSSLLQQHLDKSDTTMKLQQEQIMLQKKLIAQLKISD